MRSAEQMPTGLFFFTPPPRPRFITRNVAAGVERKRKQTVYSRKRCDAHIAEGKLEAASAAS